MKSWNVNYVTPQRNVPRDREGERSSNKEREEKVTMDCFLFESTTVDRVKRETFSASVLKKHTAMRTMGWNKLVKTGGIPGDL